MEQAVFYDLVRRYKDMIFRIALNYFGSPFDAEDMVQETLMKLYTANPAFESEEHAKHWLIRVTLNLCKNTVRSPWRRRTVSLEEASDLVSFDKPEQSELFQSVMGLPEKYRTVLYLFYYEDLSVREIAQLLLVKESAVTTRLSRARQMLKSELMEAADYG